MNGRVLVTGAAGFIGGVVARRLLTSLPVEEVVALDVRPPPVPPEDPRVRLVVADLRNRPAGLLEGVEAVTGGSVAPASPASPAGL